MPKVTFDIQHHIGCYWDGNGYERYEEADLHRTQDFFPRIVGYLGYQYGLDDQAQQGVCDDAGPGER